MKLLVVPVGALCLCFVIYLVAFAESEAYITYGEFDLHRLKFRWAKAEAFVDSEQVKQVLARIRSRGWTMSRLNAGPYRKLVSEESLGGGRVRLKMKQEVGRGPGSAPGSLGAVNVREHIEVVMKETPDGWKITELSIRDEWLGDRDEDF